MKQTVFRKVYVKDRLPDYGKGTGSWLSNHGLVFHWDLKDAEWWLEEIEVPSEEEVIKYCECNDKSESNDFIAGVECGIIYSYNYILNKLK